MNSEQSSQQEPNEQVHVLILLRSSVGENMAFEEFGDAVQEFTFVMCGNQEQFLKYASHYENMSSEETTSVVGGLTMRPIALSGFATNKRNMYVQGASMGLVELLKKTQSDPDSSLPTNLSIN